MPKAFKLIIINWIKKSKLKKSRIQIITAEKTTTPHSTYIHTPLLSSTRHTHTSLDPYTPLKPNQTATPVKPYRMVKTASDGCPAEEANCSGNKSFLFCWFCEPVI